MEQCVGQWMISGGWVAVARLVQGLEVDRLPLTLKILSRLFNLLSSSSVLGTSRTWGDYICRNWVSQGKLRSFVGKKSSQNIWLWRLVEKSWRALRKRDSICKWLMQKFMCSEILYRVMGSAVIWKLLGQTHLLIMESFLEKQKTNRVSPGDTDPGSSHFWEAILPQGHRCWQVLFWSPPSSLSTRDCLPTRQPAPVLGHTQAVQPATLRPGLIHQQLTGSKPGRPWQPTGPGTSPTCQCVYSSWPHYNRRAHAAHIVGIFRAQSSKKQWGVCC